MLTRLLQTQFHSSTMSSTPPASRQPATPGEGGLRTGYSDLGDILHTAKVHIWSASTAERKWGSTSIIQSLETWHSGDHDVDINFIFARERIHSSAGIVELWTSTGQRFLFLNEHPKTRSYFWGATSALSIHSVDREDTLLLLFDQKIQSRYMASEDCGVVSAYLGRHPTSVNVVDRYAMALHHPGLQISIETRLKFRIWPFRSLHSGWGAACCHTVPKQQVHMEDGKSFFLLLRPELVYKRRRYKIRSAATMLKATQACTPTYSDVIPVRTNYWVKLGKEILTLMVYAQYCAMAREVQLDMIALYLARYLRQIFYIVQLAIYLGGHVYYAMNPTVRRLEGWRLRRRRHRKKQSARDRPTTEGAELTGDRHTKAANKARWRTRQLRRTLSQRRMERGYRTARSKRSLINTSSVRVFRSTQH